MSVSTLYQTTMQAQLFFINLHHQNLLFPLDDPIRDAIGHLVGDEQCAKIQCHIDAIQNNDLDWGLFQDADGFCIALHSGELDEWLKSMGLMHRKVA